MTVFDDDQLDELSRLLGVPPEAIRRCQLGHTGEHAGEAKLAAAVLLQALRDLSEAREPRHAPRWKERPDLGEVLDWFDDREADGVFSLNGVCALLGRDPETVRRGVHEWLKLHPQREIPPSRDALLEAATTRQVEILRDHGLSESVIETLLPRYRKRRQAYAARRLSRKSRSKRAVPVTQPLAAGRFTPDLYAEQAPA